MKLAESTTLAASSRRHILIATLLALIILAAFGARLYEVNHSSLGNDEISHVVRAIDANSLSQILQGDHSRDAKHILYEAITYLYIKAFSPSHESIRYLAVFFGTLAVLGMYLLGAALFDKWTGLLASVFMAFSSTPIYFSQYARSYTIAIPALIFATYFLVKVIKAVESNDIRGGRVYGFAYLPISALACYLHFFFLAAVFLILVYWIAVSWQNRAIRTRLVQLFGALAALLIPLMIMHWRMLNTEGYGGLSWITQPSFHDVKDLARFLLWRTDKSLSVLTVVLMGWIGVAVVRRFARVSQAVEGAVTSQKIGFLIYWLVLPPFLTYVYSIFVSPLFVDRYLVICLPASYLLISVSLTSLSGLIIRSQKKTAVMTAAIALISGMLIHHLFTGVRHYKTHWHADFRGAARYLVKLNPSAENRQILSLAWSDRYFPYYLRQLGGRDYEMQHFYWGYTQEPKRIATIVSDLSAEKEVILIWGHEYMDEVEPLHLAFLDTHRVEEKIELNSAGVIKYSLKD